MRKQIETSNSRTMAASIKNWVTDLKREHHQACFSDFQMEHRLEYVATIKGVQYINDSKATNVNATWYALEATEGPIVLIIGGIDKGNDYTILQEVAKEKVGAIICLGKDNRKLLSAFTGVVPRITEAKTMDEAVNKATWYTAGIRTIMLSPACASFDLFENYIDRGKKFKEAVLRM